MQSKKKFQTKEKDKYENPLTIYESYKTKLEDSPSHESEQQFPYHAGVKWQEDILPVQFKIKVLNYFKNYKFPYNMVH